MINKVSPYSSLGMKKALTHLIIDEWSGLSSVRTTDGKNKFLDMISDVIEISEKRSEFFFDKQLIVYIEKIQTEMMAKKNEFSTKSFETKKLEDLNKKLKKISVSNEIFNFNEFNKELLKYIQDKYTGVNNINPKSLKNISHGNIKENLINVKNTKIDRLSKFKGFSCKRRESFHFVDSLSAAIVFYNKTQGINSIETLLSGLTSYVLKVVEIRNTKLIIKKINEIELKNLKIEDVSFNFGQFSKLRIESEFKPQTNEKSKIENITNNRINNK